MSGISGLRRFASGAMDMAYNATSRAASATAGALSYGASGAMNVGCGAASHGLRASTGVLSYSASGAREGGVALAKAAVVQLKDDFVEGSYESVEAVTSLQPLNLANTAVKTGLRLTGVKDLVRAAETKDLPSYGVAAMKAGVSALVINGARQSLGLEGSSPGYVGVVSDAAFSGVLTGVHGAHGLVAGVGDTLVGAGSLGASAFDAVGNMVGPILTGFMTATGCEDIAEEGSSDYGTLNRMIGGVGDLRESANTAAVGALSGLRGAAFHVADSVNLGNLSGMADVTMKVANLAFIGHGIHEVTQGLQVKDKVVPLKENKVTVEGFEVVLVQHTKTPGQRDYFRVAKGVAEIVAGVAFASVWSQSAVVEAIS